MDNITTIEETCVRRIYAPDDHEFLGYEVSFTVVVADPTLKGSIAAAAAIGLADYYGLRNQEVACEKPKSENEKQPEPEKQPETPNSFSGSSEAAEAPTRRRHGGAAGAGGTSEGASAPTAEAGDASGEASTGRRRRAPAASSAPADAGGEAGAASLSGDGAPRRRRREPEPAKAPEPEVPAIPATGDISDIDLTKAASNAAGILTPAVVKEVLALFQKADGSICTTVSEVQQNERRDFLASLKAEVEEAQAKD